jgi:uncharacterized protein YqkB
MGEGISRIAADESEIPPLLIVAWNDYFYNNNNNIKHNYVSELVLHRFRRQYEEWGTTM